MKKKIFQGFKELRDVEISCNFPDANQTDVLSIGDPYSRNSRLVPLKQIASHRKTLQLKEAKITPVRKHSTPIQSRQKKGNQAIKQQERYYKQQTKYFRTKVEQGLNIQEVGSIADSVTSLNGSFSTLSGHGSSQHNKRPQVIVYDEDNMGNVYISDQKAEEIKSQVLSSLVSEGINLSSPNDPFVPLTNQLIQNPPINLAEAPKSSILASKMKLEIKLNNSYKNLKDSFGSSSSGSPKRVVGKKAQSPIHRKLTPLSVIPNNTHEEKKKSNLPIINFGSESPSARVNQLAIGKSKSPFVTGQFFFRDKIAGIQRDLSPQDSFINESIIITQVQPSDDKSPKLKKKSPRLPVPRLSTKGHNTLSIESPSINSTINIDQMMPIEISANVYIKKQAIGGQGESDKALMRQESKQKIKEIISHKNQMKQQERSLLNSSKSYRSSTRIGETQVSQERIQITPKRQVIKVQQQNVIPTTSQTTDTTGTPELGFSTKEFVKQKPQVSVKIDRTKGRVKEVNRTNKSPIKASLLQTKIEEKLPNRLAQANLLFRQLLLSSLSSVNNSPQRDCNTEIFGMTQEKPTIPLRNSFIKSASPKKKSILIKIGQNSFETSKRQTQYRNQI